MVINASDIWKAMIGAATSSLGKDWSKVRAYAEPELKRLAKTLVDIGKQTVSGDITVSHVPGALEIPLVVQTFAGSGKYDAVIALGAVIRGSTPHFDIVAGESAKALSSIALTNSVPVINAILTTDTIEQAIERAGTKAGNKGADAAMSAMEMISLLRKIK